jgi:hypothetical protein
MCPTSRPLAEEELVRSAQLPSKIISMSKLSEAIDRNILRLQEICHDCTPSLNFNASNFKSA